MGGQGGVVCGVENEGYLVYVEGLSTDDGIMHIAQHCTHTHTTFDLLPQKRLME